MRTCLIYLRIKRSRKVHKKYTHICLLLQWVAKVFTPSICKFVAYNLELGHNCDCVIIEGGGNCFDSLDILIIYSNNNNNKQLLNLLFLFIFYIFLNNSLISFI